MDWSTAEDLQAQVRRLWDRGRLLVTPSEGGTDFPLSLRLRRPESSAMSDQFDDVRRWIRALDDGSKARRGFGYEIEWTEIDHRQLGRNSVPAAAFVPTREDALSTRRETEAGRQIRPTRRRNAGAVPRAPRVVREEADGAPRE
jgi:hypothetical protein